MKRCAAGFLAAALLLCSCSEKSKDKPDIRQNSPPPSEAVTAPSEIREEEIDDKYSPLNYDEQKAVWISYLDMDRLIADNEKQFKENIIGAFDNIASLGLNTVYVHVRAFGDSYYMSSEFPLNSSIPKEEGTPLYDPLKIMIKLAHERKLSLHAWINPLRLSDDYGMEQFSDDSIIYKCWDSPDEHPQEIVKPYDSNFYWINPASEELRQYIAGGAAEICENYDVDGIHIDDYFYPTTETYFDSDAFSKALAEDSTLDLAEWRRGNCSELVREIYSAVKSVNEDIEFGISPQGNIENNMDQMYADVELWCSEEGYADYICPQIYFGYYNTVCPFTETLIRWENMMKSENVKLVCGLGLYQADQDSEFINDTGIIARQIGDITADVRCSGFAIYSYDSLFCKDSQRFNDEREAISAIID
ncbi:MAG: family 10 glycosylhydrolase [Oscillospiraceae bacterium]|nr:family 10 glycosylhydrolase [Oscillospiraceae bacterium]